MKNDLSQAFLIVDGHNLAYLLFDFKAGTHLSPEIAERMAKFFSAYRAQFDSPAPQIELCFDGGVRPAGPDPEGVRILAAGLHNKADHLILDRFRVHQFFKQPCLAISNDMEVLERIEQEGGATLKAFDLVLLRHPRRPMFMAPGELLAKFPAPSKNKPRKLLDEGIMDARWRVGALKSDQVKNPPLPPLEKRGVRAGHSIPVLPIEKKGMEENDARALLPPFFQGGAGGDSATPANLAPVEKAEIPPLQPEPHYTLSVAQWPIAAGVKFLMKSFCHRHRPEFLELLSAFDPAQLRPADLEVLADFLRDHCSQEPGFARHGSLMNRVRLALLKAGPDGLSLSQLVAETGLPCKGLHGRIKSKATRWLEIKTM